jgi:cell division protein FtsL
MIRVSLVIWLIVAAAVAVGLYQVKYEVQRLEEELGVVQSNIQENREALHVLEAEWSYLNRPARLSRLAKEHLDLQPLQPKQVAHVQQLPPRITEPDERYDEGERPALDGVPVPHRKPWSLQPQLAGGQALAEPGESR